MSSEVLATLATLINQNREPVLAQWRALVRAMPSAKHLDVPTLNDHVPSLLAELAEALRTADDQTISEALREGSPPVHGLQRIDDGYDIEEVVAEYNMLRQCIHDLADQNGVRLQGEPFHILNRVLDGAIGMAVQTFAKGQAAAVQHRREEYLAFVAHDLRTPLNAIALSARVLEFKFPKEDLGDVQRMLKTLNRNVARLNVLVHKIVDENDSIQNDARIAVQRRTFDLWPLVEALVHDLHAVAGATGTRLVNEVPDDLVACADAGLMTRVFQNLLANAIKYTPGGKVVIGAAEVGERGAVECWVRDTGAGIPPAIADTLFDKGETDPDTEGGLGLGLAIVKTFVEAHGGTVSADRNPTGGTTFKFSIPGASETAG
jgi:two-component system phosphate regulon sensor histidine kinase PhoR